MRRTGYVFLVFLSLAIAGYAVIAYGLRPLDSIAGPQLGATFQAHATALYSHVFASAVALGLGGFQFSSRLRTKHLRLHRWMGRVYLGVGVLIGGIAGLFMATHAFGGATARLGFGCLAVLWLYTGLRAYLAIRAGDVVVHRRWMVRNFSLTFAAVTLRLYLPAASVAGIPFEIAYPIIAWAAWVPNLIAAEWFFNRARRAMGVLATENVSKTHRARAA
jgi:uncharacterized membrane protein